MMMKVTELAKRHWDKDFSGTKVKKYSVTEFEELLEKINNSDMPRHKPSGIVLNDYNGYYIKTIDGYAPFCKLFVYRNFAEVRTGTIPITLDNYQHLRSGYHSRNEKELPVLSRWFDLPLSAPVANCLVLVCYTGEQLKKEFDANNPKNGFRNCLDWPIFICENAEWGIVAILGQMGEEEEPMTPATMLRNALGIKEGGSGIALDREKYLKSVEFWRNHATVKS